ncbi:hypothetical protein QQF64_029042 [Cirrhinus molitorella]|uniref:Uncharacterized protein n=1 Tax=Cirrhinus molitorella TaxID=172907 RepID=A0ABR3N8D1_9TELE
MSENIMKSNYKQHTLMPMDCTSQPANQPHIWKTQCRKGMGFQHYRTMDQIPRPGTGHIWLKDEDSSKTPAGLVSS